MKYNPEFDVDLILRTLGTINAKYEEGSPEDEALRVAAVALLYVRETRKLDDYRTYFSKFFAPATESVTITHTFTTSEEADHWLARGTASPGELVRIAGIGFQVIQGPKGLKFLRTPLPEELGMP